MIYFFVFPRVKPTVQIRTFVFESSVKDFSILVGFKKSFLHFLQFSGQTRTKNNAKDRRKSTTEASEKWRARICANDLDRDLRRPTNYLCVKKPFERCSTTERFHLQPAFTTTRYSGLPVQTLWRFSFAWVEICQVFYKISLHLWITAHWREPLSVSKILRTFKDYSSKFIATLSLKIWIELSQRKVS